MGRPKLTLRSMMAGVAAIALALAAFRTGVFALIAACVSVMAWKRTSDGIARGLATGFWQKASLLATSTLVSAVILGLSDITYLVGLLISLGPSSPFPDEGEIVAGSVAGVVAALCVATLLRKTFWPIQGHRDETPIRPFGVAFAAIYLGVVGLVLFATSNRSFDGRGWAEVVYGYTLTAGSCVLLVVVALCVEGRIRGRSPAADRPMTPRKGESRPTSQFTPRPRS